MASNYQIKTNLSGRNILIVEGVINIDLTEEIKTEDFDIICIMDTEQTHSELSYQLQLMSPFHSLKCHLKPRFLETSLRNRVLDLGTVVDGYIDSIDDTVSLYVPPGIQSGEKIKIEGKGTSSTETALEEENINTLSIKYGDNVSSINTAEFNKFTGTILFEDGQSQNVVLSAEDKAKNKSNLLNNILVFSLFFCYHCVCSNKKLACVWINNIIYCISACNSL